MKKFFNITFRIGILICLIIFILSKDEFNKNINEKYFKNFNLELSAFVTDKKEITSDRGMLYADIISSNIVEYDPRDSLEYYYCVIKNNKIELHESGFSFISIGDSIVVSSKKNKISVFRNSKLIRKHRLYIPDLDFYNRRFKKLHRL